MASLKTNGVAIRAIRERAGISVTGLAAAVGVHKSVISRIETGAQIPRSFITIRKIADRLGVPLDAITYPSPEPEPEPEVKAS